MTSHLAVGLCMFAVGFLVGYVLMPSADEPRPGEHSAAQGDGAEGEFAAAVKADRDRSRTAPAGQSRRLKARIDKLEHELAQARPEGSTDTADTATGRDPRRGETFVGGDEDPGDPPEIDGADTPEPFPEEMPPRLEEGELTSAFSDALKQIDGASFSHVDCSEYPCVVYGELTSGSSIKHLRNSQVLSAYSDDLLRINRLRTGAGSARRLRVGIVITPRKNLTATPRSKLLARIRRRTNQEFGIEPKPAPAD